MTKRREDLIRKRMAKLTQRYWVTAAQLSIIETVVCGPKTRQAPEIFTALLDDIRTKQLINPERRGAAPEEAHPQSD